MKKLNFTGEIDGNSKIKIYKNEVGNIVVLKFEIRQMYINKALPYELCIENVNQTIALLAFQSAQFNLLPPNA